MKGFFHRPFLPMKSRKILFAIFFTSLFSFLLCPPPSSFALDKPFDHSTWDAFLKKFVNEKGEVDYAGIKKDPKLLNDYLARLAAIDLGDFNFNWPREEKLALWLNAYHAGVISVIVKYYPVKSIQDIPGVWNAASIEVAMKNHTLNDIRAGDLIGVFHDEKIHTVLACGAKSCPKLRNEAYTGQKVDGQLFLATRAFVNDPDRNRIIPGEKKSSFPEFSNGTPKIFSWILERWKKSTNFPRKRPLCFPSSRIIWTIHRRSSIWKTGIIRLNIFPSIGV